MENFAEEFQLNKAGMYSAVIPAGNYIIQLEREAAGLLVVSTFIEGCAPVPQVSKEFGKNVIFEVDFPTSLQLSISSKTKVNVATGIEKN